jgi:uncharacterized protein (DUF2141 family)
VRKIVTFGSFFLIILANINVARAVNAQSTETLTVVVNGLQRQKGQLCLGVYSNEQGFPFSNKSVVRNFCTKITKNSLVTKFSGLKPGTYAVAVVDDRNGDRKLNTDFFGIPKEGFGVSNNPTVSVTTGTPKFSNASFSLLKNTTINIVMKYGLDP